MGREDPVALDPRRCLRLRSRHNDCDRCAQGCPARVLRASHVALELHDGCVRCGRCAAACPTGALQTAGFALTPARAAASVTPIYVDCWKVPASVSPPAAARMPCLGGIAAHHLVRWHAASGGRAIALLDRGWCGGCSAGSAADHPVSNALAAARGLLAGLGVAERDLPRLEVSPLPRAQMPLDIPEASAAQPLARREFFAGVTRTAVRTLAPLSATERTEPRAAQRTGPPAKLEATARSQLLAHAAVVAARHGRALPATLFPALRISDACRNHQVCAALCPTGALRSYADDEGAAAGIAFDAAACIACGDCTRGCPEGALTLMPAGCGAPASGTALLTRWTARECDDCGYEFADSGPGRVCPACRKTREMTQMGFSRLFGGARGSCGPPSEREIPAGAD